MSSFNANSQIYNITTENELSEVLSHYSSEYVYSIIDESLKKRFQVVPVTAMPNVVGAWEKNFKVIKAQYGEEAHSQVLTVRNETYREIIDTICKEFDLNFTIDDSVDLFSAAFVLYDTFVCKFSANLVWFFANFIYKERANLYDSLGLSELKKNKDSSTIYGKKIYKDIRLAVINANIDMVVSQISEMDIPFHTVIATTCGLNSEVYKYLLSIISANGDFFKSAFVSVLNSDIRAEVITSIRFKLQEIAIAHDQTVDGQEVLPVADTDDKGE